jgi:hypothetical protein
VRPDAAVEVLARRCDQRPGSVLEDLLARLYAKPDQLAKLLRGEAVRVELLLAEREVPETWIVFTALGHVATATQTSSLGADYRPHVLFRGTAEDVLRVVLGVTPLERAVYSGVFMPFIPVNRFSRLLDFLAAELTDMAVQASTTSAR